MAETLVQQLKTLLEGERALILEGNYPALAELLPNKTELLRKLGAEGAGPKALRGIAEALQRNQKLLAAARDGHREALRRLREIESTASGFQGYGQTGQRQSMGQSGPSRFERKF